MSSSNSQLHYDEVHSTAGFPNAPTVEAFVQDRTRFACIMGPYGSAKTTGVLNRIMDHILEQEPNREGIRPTRWIATRTTYKELTTTTIPDTLNIFGPLGIYKEASGLKPPTFHFDWDNPDGTRCKGEILFVALDREEDAIAFIAGQKPTGGWVHEGSNTRKSVVDALAKRVGRFPLPTEGGVKCTWSGILVDTNAMNKRHWYYHQAEEARPRGWVFFRQPGAVVEHPGKGKAGKSTWSINPQAENLANVGEAYYLDGLEGIDDDWIRVKLGNEYGFTIDGKAVHPEYVDSIHCAAAPLEPEDAPIYLGQDYGRTPATLVFQIDRAFDRYLILDEFCSDSKGISAQEYAPELKRWLDREFPGLPIAGAWGDPAGDKKGEATDDTPIGMMQLEGLPFVPAPTNNPLVRRKAISGPIRRNCSDGRCAFLLSPKCEVTREGLMGGFCYRKLQVKGDRYTEEPEKNEFSHPVEALEYGLLGAGEDSRARQTKVVRMDRWKTQRFAIMD